ncbi:MAG: single-stranded-DNA-specific exonuclease RecJ [Clostridiales Family XIII bacterium]|nr:single-stranded-DNA-specific exonuclease RecJ [Clostridiales Family XIII bacterium]
MPKLSIDEILEQIYSNRGLADLEKLEEFTSTKPVLNYDPFLIPCMEDGVDLLHDALEAGANVCVYGDYDCDGVTSTALIYSFLKLAISQLISEPDSSKQEDSLQPQSKITCYIPNRIEEGYGLNMSAIEKISASGCDLIITVDCGSVSAAEVAYAHELGMEIIITDHHEVDPNHIPDCPVINPKLPDGIYPYQSISGCTVAYKFAQAYQRRYGDERMRKAINNMLDLVAISIISDVMPVVDENRTLLKYGLNMLRKGTRPSLRALCNAISIDSSTINETSIGFGIAPHINAAGRVGDAAAPLKFLLTSDETKLNGLVSKLIEYNNTRKTLQSTCFDYCKTIMDIEQKNYPILVIDAGVSHEGIIGIVAGKLKELSSKPAIVLTATDEDGVLKASCRSIGRLNIIELLRSHNDLFLKLGGHAMAAGFSIKEEKLDDLVTRLIEDVETQLAADPTLFSEGLEVDIDTDADSIPLELELVERLDVLAPYGGGNPQPTFALNGLISDIFYMGKEKQHVKFKTGGLTCVYFSHAADYKDVLKPGSEIRITGNLNLNEYKGSKSLQMIVRKIG